MFKKYLLSSVYFAPDDETGAKEEVKEKTPVEVVRDGIVVTVHKKDDDGEPIPDKEDEVKEPEKVEEVIETKEDEIENNEEKQEELEQEKLDAKTEREKEKVQKRIDRLTAKNKELEKELAAANRKLEADPDKKNVLTEDDVEDRAEKKATEKQIQREFTNDCNFLADEATKIDKTFPNKIDVLNKEIGAIPGVMIGILKDLDNGGAILNHLTDNLEDAEDIFKLNPIKMGVELTKLSVKLAAKPKRPIKEISKTPDPITPLGGGSPRMATVPDPKKDPEAWIEWRKKDVAKKREQGNYTIR